MVSSSVSRSKHLSNHNSSVSGRPHHVCENAGNFRYPVRVPWLRFRYRQAVPTALCCLPASFVRPPRQRSSPYLLRAPGSPSDDSIRTPVQSTSGTVADDGAEEPRDSWEQRQVGRKEEPGRSGHEDAPKAPMNPMRCTRELRGRTRCGQVMQLDSRLCRVCRSLLTVLLS